MRMSTFDYFQGLPEIAANDENTDPFCTESASRGLSNEVRRNLSSNSAIVNFTEGFYNNSLTPKLTDEMLSFHTFILHIDVYLYSSTIDLLKWLDSLSLSMHIYLIIYGHLVMILSKLIREPFMNITFDRN